MAAHPTGESSPLAAQTMQPAPMPAAADGGAAARGADGRGPPVVTIYGTSWCGACRAARQYLTERKIPFADKDVERDPTRRGAGRQGRQDGRPDRPRAGHRRARAAAARFRQGAHRSAAGRAARDGPSAPVAAAVLAAALALPAAAEARLIDLRPPRQAGGMFGWGQRSAVPDFFRQSGGPRLRLRAGRAAAGLDLSMSFLQLIDSKAGCRGTLITGSCSAWRSTSRWGTEVAERPERHVLHAGIAGGVALGTGARSASRSQRAGRRQGRRVALPARLRVLLEPVHGRRRAAATSATTTSWPASPINNSGPLLRLPHHRPGDFILPPRSLAGSGALLAQRVAANLACFEVGGSAAPSFSRGPIGLRQVAVDGPGEDRALGCDGADRREGVGVLAAQLAQRRVVVLVRHVDAQQRVARASARRSRGGRRP